MKENGVDNMATDWWLLQKAGDARQTAFRHYLWQKQETSFGYGQNWKWVERKTEEPIDRLIRRPTGGGIVRHGEDWTYCLIIPRGCRHFESSSLTLYEGVHQAMGDALEELGIPSRLQPCPSEKSPGIPGDCFEEPVGKDLMNEGSKLKIAGAAMKKTRGGILFQGTLDPRFLSGAEFHSEKFLEHFIDRLSDFFEEDREDAPWPKTFAEDRASFVRQFDCLNWKMNRERD